MTDLYKEALAEARKIRELAEEDAKKHLLEKITPFVKEMVGKDLKSRTGMFMSEGADLKEKIFAIGEQEEDPLAPQPPALDPNVPPTAAGAPVPAPMAQDPAAPPTGAMPPVSAPMPSSEIPSPDAGAALSDPSLGAPPVEPTGSELGSTTLDQLGDDGKIVVDVNDLFSPGSASGELGVGSDAELSTDVGDMSPPEAISPETADLNAPEPGSPEDEALNGDEEDNMPVAPPAPVTTEVVVNSINEVAYKIDVLCLNESGVKDLTKNFYKQRLFSLLEQVDNLKENGLVSGRQAKIMENKLEFLFIKLKEANLANSYRKVYREENDNMTRSLKTIAAQLFLEENDPMEKTQTSADSRVGANSQHAKKASGNTVGAKADSEHTVPSKEKETFWDDQDPNGEGVLEENSEAGGETVHAATGFGEGEEPEVEFEVSEADLMEAIRQLRKESVSKKVKALKESLKECDMQMQEEGFGDEEDAGLDLGSDEGDDFGAEDDGAAVGGIDVEAAEQELQAAFDALGLGVTVDLDAGGADAGLGDDEEIEIVDDGDDLGSEEEGISLHDSEDEATMMESARSGKKTLSESARLAAMKKEMDENNLFTAKTVFLNKILMRESLTKETARKVVEFLDKARTLAEAKEIYQKILGRLNEGKSAASKKMPGTASSSRATRQGSLMSESVNRTQESGVSVSRWQELSGIKKVER